MVAAHSLSAVRDTAHACSQADCVCCMLIPLHNGTMSIGVVQDQGDATNMKRALHKCKGDCTLMDYYLDKLKAAPGVLKYIVNGKLGLTGKGGGVHIKQAANFS